VSNRLTIFLGFVALIAAGMLVVGRAVLSEIPPHTYTAVEESLAETSVLLASVLEVRASHQEIPVADLRTAMNAALRRDLAASIHEMQKRTVDLRIYVTDSRGIVLYDSDGGRDEGQDYSRWHDVYSTLHGLYGARASRDVAEDPYSSVHYVAAPIRVDGRTVGVLSVGKPVKGLRGLIGNLRRQIAYTGLLALAAATIVSLLLAHWIARPLTRLAAYSAAVAAGQRPRLPVLGGREVRALARALEAMREALEGKRYVEEYVRSLTHEIKAPLSAIRAAAELLDESMPPDDRRRFAENIRRESERLQTLVDRMLELSAVEARGALRDTGAVDLATLQAEVAETVEPLLRLKHIRLELPAHPPEAIVTGDRLLLRQALLNLVHNALQATPAEGAVRLALAVGPTQAVITVADTGPGVPEYALPRVFERFYSLPLPGQERRGTGLGLPFVREVALLHGGSANLENAPEGGARATLSLPLRA
jgi:two-component system, OmpR family, sensor histidine kinase CreC